MLRISKVFVFASFLFAQLSMLAQSSSENSPYSRYGYGNLADRSFGAGRAMGGIGYGLRSSKQINPMNPASYSAIDSMTFILDFGISAQLSWFDDGINKQKNKNGNFEYVALQFPVTKRIAFSAGILPYSHVGYDFSHVEVVENETYINNLTGKGGLNDAYVGVSIDIWKKRLSVGVNAGYLFGTVTHSNALAFGSSTSALPVEEKQEIRVNDLKLDAGLQYTHPISKTERVTVGMVFSPSNKLNAKVYKTRTEGEIGTASAVRTVDTLSNLAFDLPNSYGVGFSYAKLNKLTAGVDFSYETWEDARFESKKEMFSDRYRVAGGIEYIPDYMDRSFLKRMRYRVGGHYGNSYQQVNSTESGLSKAGYKEYGASVGFGLPLIDNRSFLNLSFEYVRVNPKERYMIDEQYFRVTLNYTFNEQWFFKFRLK